MLMARPLNEKVEEMSATDNDPFPYLWECVQSAVGLGLFLFNMMLYCCCNSNKKQRQREDPTILELNGECQNQA